MEAARYICYNDIVNPEYAVYVHVPFCRRKCGYCSFISCAYREQAIPAYADSLCHEITTRADGGTAGTVFFGGGTPSLLSLEQVSDILSAVQKGFRLQTDAEISLEANPGTVDTGYLAGLRRMGVNRLSLGVQSFNDEELALLGRIHDAAGARAALADARAAGFMNVNLDFIYGLPGQTEARWRRTLEEAVSLHPEHLSLYALTLDEGTPLYTAVEKGDAPTPDPDAAAGHYELAEDMLKSSGYVHYEISNWALPGYECRHNLVYWHNEPYFGFGAAAHSSLGGHRLANTGDLDAYIASGGDAVEMDETIPLPLCRAETLILGLRLVRGIDVAGMSARLGMDIRGEYGGVFRDMEQAGLMERDNGFIRLTRRGRLLGNEVFWRLLPETEPASL